jgi:hypothetical protein
VKETGKVVLVACATAILGPVVFCLLVLAFRALGNALAELANLISGGPY